MSDEAQPDQPRPAIFDWEIFPFEGDIRIKGVQPPALPERPRAGEPGGRPCPSCPRGDDEFVWVDDHWRVAAPRRPGAVVQLFLETRAHYDLADLPAELSASLGPMIQKLEAAFLATRRYGRVHVNRWGDGGSHLHFWFYGRPLGNRQFLGFFLPMWNTLLPPMTEDEWKTALDEIAANLRSG